MQMSFTHLFLSQEHGEDELKRWGLLRVSENFRVIALGLPVPKYTGVSLDPPLRSRFQARDITSTTYHVRIFGSKKCTHFIGI